MNRFRTLAGLLLLFLLFHGSPADARRARILGEITAVDLNATPPRVTVSDGTASETLAVTERTRLVEESAPGTLADLRVGAGAEVSYETRTLTALAIAITLADDQSEQIGVITAVDPVNLTVALSTDDDPVPDLTIFLDAATELSVGGVAITAGELSLIAGEFAVVEYFVDSHVATEVRLEMPLVRTQPGTVIAATPESLRLVLRGNGELTLALSAGTEVRIGALPAPAHLIQGGDRVRVEYADLSGGALALRVVIRGGRARTATGQLLAVGPEAVTFSTRGGSLELSLTDAATLRLNGRPASLAQLEAVLEHGPVRIKARYLVRGAANVAVSVRASARVPR